jgi:hypothetical protein
MGAAKARGTFEQRRQDAIGRWTPAARREQQRRDQEAAEAEHEAFKAKMRDDAAARQILRQLNRPARRVLVVGSPDAPYNTLRRALGLDPD